jgi:cell division protein ZapA
MGGFGRLRRLGQPRVCVQIQGMADKPDLVHLEIFGQTYAVRGGADPGYVRKLAAFVDAQMQEVSRSSGAVDSVRVAVLAALNISDELFQARGQTGEAEKKVLQRAAAEVGARVEALSRQLDSVLAD